MSNSPRRSTEPDRAPDEARPGRPASAAERGRVLRVLYVEDNEADFRLAHIAAARQAPKLELERARNLAAAREALDRPERYDLVLIDLHLPDGSGLELLSHIRERRLPLAVVLLTGGGDHRQAVAALRAGADDYLAKHDDYLERLATILDEALARYRHTAEFRARPIRVLYAERNRDDAELVRRHALAHAAQIQLQLVADGEQLLARLAAAGQPAVDLVLMDYHLPGSDALELVQRIRQELNLDLPVVIVTAHGSVELVAQALRLGVSDYLFKHEGFERELIPLLEKVHRQHRLVGEQRSLRRAAARLQQVLSVNPTILYSMPWGDGRPAPTWVSDNIEPILGFRPAEACTEDWWYLNLFEDDREQALANWRQLARSGRLAQEYRFLTRTGEQRWIRDDMRLIRGAGGQPVEVVGSWSDVTQQRRTNLRLRLDAAVFESTADGVVITDVDGRIEAVNRNFTQSTGYPEAELLGNNPRILKSGRHSPEFYAAMWQALRRDGIWSGEVWNRRRNGEIYPTSLTLRTVYDDAGAPAHHVGVSTDLSRIKRSEAQLEHVAHYDPLTDLPNRLLIQSRLDYMIEQARHGHYRLAVLFVNLDRFKTVNESLGHPMGDELLSAVARRIGATLGEEATIGRVGGDEFVVLLQRIRWSNQPAAVARSLIDALAGPFTLGEQHEVYVTASLGISVYPDDAEDASELIRDADSAMHQAKDQGRNTYRFYTERLTQAASARLALETRLRGALEREELILHYQPLVAVADNRVLGVEALLRWRGQDGNLIAPDRFIPLAEETGIILPMGAWVLAEACRQFQHWRRAGHALDTLAVNLSVRQLQDPEVVQIVAQALRESALPAHCLELEITESGLMVESDRSELRLLDLKALGVRLAIDDFGTGYSSLGYLSRLPFDKLKIDRSFINGVTENAHAAEIASTIVAMARSLHLEVLAEGVESAAQLQFLRERGCDAYQGYLFSRPLEAADLPPLLGAGPP